MRLTSIAAAFLLAVSMPSLSSTDGCSDPTPTPEPTPACRAEVCDGIDNDCDGDIDNGIPFAVRDVALTLDFSGGQSSVSYIPCGTIGELKLTSQGLKGISVSGAFSSIPAQDGYTNTTVVPYPGRQFTVTYTLALDGQFDSTGLYGSVESGQFGTFLWPYNAGQVFPAPIGQDESVIFSKSVVRGVPSGSTAYFGIAPYQPVNLYQIGLVVDQFQSPVHVPPGSVMGTSLRLIPNVKSPGVNEQILEFGTPYLDQIESWFGEYPSAAGQTTLDIIGVDWCTPESTSCPYAGMEEIDKKISYTNMDQLDSITDPSTGKVTGKQYTSGIGVLAHELFHSWGPSGQTIRPACVADFLPFGEGWTTYASDELRAQVDKFHTIADFQAFHLRQIDGNISAGNDILAWPYTCSETPGSTPPNYAPLTYYRGRMFWSEYGAVVGRDQLFAWVADIQSRAVMSPQNYALTGEELLDDAASFLGVDARDVVVIMTDGTSKSLVDGWLRTVGSRPVQDTAMKQIDPNQDPTCPEGLTADQWADWAEANPANAAECPIIVIEEPPQSTPIPEYDYPGDPAPETTPIEWEYEPITPAPTPEFEPTKNDCQDAWNSVTQATGTAYTGAGRFDNNVSIGKNADCGSVGATHSYKGKDSYPDGTKLYCVRPYAYKSTIDYSVWVVWEKCTP